MGPRLRNNRRALVSCAIGSAVMVAVVVADWRQALFNPLYLCSLALTTASSAYNLQSLIVSQKAGDIFLELQGR